MGDILSKKTLLPNLKLLAMPLLILVLSIGLILAIVFNAYPRINSLLTSLDEASDKNAILEERVDILSQLQEGLSFDLDVTTRALPVQNPGTFTLSHARQIASNYEIEINKIEFKKPTTDNEMFEHMILTLESQTNSVQSILDFLSDITRIVPLVTLENVSVENFGTYISFNTDINLYWSKLPEKLPSLQSPIQELTENDIRSLDLLKTYKTYSIDSLEPGTPGIDRQNPFN